jgi:hypothetical protein
MRRHGPLSIESLFLKIGGVARRISQGLLAAGGDGEVDTRNSFYRGILASWLRLAWGAIPAIIFSASWAVLESMLACIMVPDRS